MTPADNPQDNPERHSPRFSIANQLRYGFIIFVIVSLSLTGGLLIYLSFQAQLQQLVLAQQESSRAAAAEINAYLDDLQRKLGYLARVQGLTDLPPDIQHNLLAALLRHNTAYEAVAIVDRAGQVVTAVSLAGEPIFQGDLAGTPFYSRAFKQHEDFVGPVEREAGSGQPFVTLAVPIRDRQDEVAGVLVARIKLTFLWFIVSQVEVGQTGYSYVVDNRQVVIARKGSTPETFAFEDISDRPFFQALLSGAAGDLITYEGLNGPPVLGTIAPIRSVRWNVVVELPAAEAYQPLRTLLLAMGAALSLTLLLAVAASVLLARQIVHPLQRLTQASARFSAGDIDVQVEETNAPHEIGLLAAAFNHMTAQIRHLVSGLEDRSRRLEIVAALSERLAAILNLETLLPEVVNQVKTQFGYYHAHIYLLDDPHEYLVLAAGAGEAGATMKSSGHRIPLTMATNPLVQAARTGRIMQADNVREAQDWAPNPLLPDTYAEMAVPISLEGQVVGVLAVQEDEIAALDESDAHLLRSVANQVAVAMRNARLFAQVETALAEARLAQERYIAQSWDKSRLVATASQHLYTRDDAAPLDETQRQLLAQARQQALAQDRPAVVTLSHPPHTPTPSTLIAPINLRDATIGTLQLHAGQGQPWTEDDLAVIETILDQVAQTAENLRLFEETRERAGREQLIGQIADKLRRAPDMETLMQTGLSELARVLGPARAFVRFDSPDQLVAAVQPIPQNGEGPQDEDHPAQPPSPNGEKGPEDEDHKP